MKAKKTEILGPTDEAVFRWFRKRLLQHLGSGVVLGCLIGLLLTLGS